MALFDLGTDCAYGDMLFMKLFVFFLGWEKINLKKTIEFKYS
jgi:hypothetical protein